MEGQDVNPHQWNVDVPSSGDGYASMAGSTIALPSGQIFAASPQTEFSPQGCQGPGCGAMMLLLKIVIGEFGAK
jgi:hypothetical protein